MGVKRRALLFTAVGAGCLIVVGAAMAILARRDDPSFNGRRLSESVYDLLEANSASYAASSNVVAQLGARAVPFLQRTVSLGESRLERVALRLNLPLPAHRMMFGRQLAVCRAVRILGTNAASLRNDLTPLAQSRVGSIRQAAIEALAVTTSLGELLPILTNAIRTDPFPDCRLTATRIAISAGANPTEVLDQLFGNIGGGTRFTSTSARAFGEQLRAISPEKALEDALTRFSRSEDPEVRRFVANCAACLGSNAVAAEILSRLALDTDGTVAAAATNAVDKARRGK
jgi:hypothetical protein